MNSKWPTPSFVHEIAPTRSVPEPSQDAKQDLAAKAASIRPTEDQIYLAEMVNQAWRWRGKLTPAALCKLNKRHGLGTVSNALRMARGFPPSIATSSAYAYVESICKANA